MNKKMESLAEIEYRRWSHCTTDDGTPFRMSAKLYCGKNMTLKYRYVWFTNADQFKTWLVKNESNLYGVVSLGI